MKYLIAGLGNVGAEYANTRHNIGFNVVDELARRMGVSFEVGRHAYVAEGKFKGRTIVLIKPTTYMNLSGKAVNFWLKELKLKDENLLVVTDDLALPFGKIRMKGKGSDGGHNGLKDINLTLGHNHYARLRFGIDSRFGKGRQVDYVLGKWNAEEEQGLDEAVNKAADAVESFCSIGLERTMNFFN
ncbi:MAG: aminoacyl-tRNA hydrolase [Bacteroidota bacterium]|nr:aminoacyl-tRNA hydrolase [Bacteroidota bacterium]MDX5430179.1 aminoacyl-tRNA hydrolase [Bacteroidota bacterium]MDX5468942.1 aminoacyl-tRNA hydrolase [Bacteroidota bacterium]